MSVDTDETNQVRNSCLNYPGLVVALFEPNVVGRCGFSEAEGRRPLRGGSHLSQDRRGAAGRVQPAEHRCHCRDGGAAVRWVIGQHSKSTSCFSNVYIFIHLKTRFAHFVTTVTLLNLQQV